MGQFVVETTDKMTSSEEGGENTGRASSKTKTTNSMTLDRVESVRAFQRAQGVRALLTVAILELGYFKDYTAASATASRIVAVNPSIARAYIIRGEAVRRRGQVSYY